MALFFPLRLGLPPLLFSHHLLSHRLASSAPAMKDETPKPFTEIPTPPGAVSLLVRRTLTNAIPLLGHYFNSDSNFSELLFKMFQEVGGPIYQLKMGGRKYKFYND